jgi:hypothetical protein
VSRRTSFHLVAAAGATVVAIALVVAVVTARPAQAWPFYESTCSTCHSTTPSGTVTATPSKTTLAPGEGYTVGIGVGLSASGSAGWWIANNDSATPDFGMDGGPGTSPFTANMTAPNAAGTYTYKVWGAKGKPGSGGMALMTTYQITVASAPPAGDTTAPTTTATGAKNNGWYKSGPTVTLTAADNAGGAGVGSITYTLDGGAPIQTPGSTVQIPVAGDGSHTITYQATDLATSPNTEAPKTLTVHVDSTKPVASVLANLRVKRGRVAAVKYRVTDTPGDGTAVTTIKIKTRAGKTVKTLRSKAQSVGAGHTLKFRCKLKKGVYKVTATAKDKAGNVSAVSAKKTLRVR